MGTYKASARTILFRVRKRAGRHDGVLTIEDVADLASNINRTMRSITASTYNDFLGLLWADENARIVVLEACYAAHCRDNYKFVLDNVTTADVVRLIGMFPTETHSDHNRIRNRYAFFMGDKPTFRYIKKLLQ